MTCPRSEVRFCVCAGFDAHANLLTKPFVAHPYAESKAAASDIVGVAAAAVADFESGNLEDLRRLAGVGGSGIAVYGANRSFTSIEKGLPTYLFTHLPTYLPTP